MLCPHCQTTNSHCAVLELCVREYFLAVPVEEVTSTSLVIAVRDTTAQIAENENVKPSGCRDWLLDKLWKMKVEVVNLQRQPVEINMDCFEPSDKDIDNDRARVFDERLRDFFRNNLRQRAHAGQMFVTQKWHQHFATMATIIGACHPEESQWWPRTIKGRLIDPRAANDNFPRDGH